MAEEKGGTPGFSNPQTTEGGTEESGVRAMREKREGRISARAEGETRLSLGPALPMHLGAPGLKHCPSRLNPGQR